PPDWFLTLRPHRPLVAAGTTSPLAASSPWPPGVFCLRRRPATYTSGRNPPRPRRSLTCVALSALSLPRHSPCDLSPRRRAARAAPASSLPLPRLRPTVPRFLLERRPSRGEAAPARDERRGARRFAGRARARFGADASARYVQPPRLGATRPRLGRRASQCAPRRRSAVPH